MDGNSKDIKQDIINRLKELCPEIFTEDKVDTEKLKLTLGEGVNISNERYVLNWAGKSEAFKVLQTTTTATLVPEPGESVNPDTTGNVFIEGENLEVLKVLQKAYYNKIKMVYIDPPYNTGNDTFVYPDRFAESKEEYLKRIGDKDETGYMLKEGLFRKNNKESGHFHSNWLSMMYPRLFLARNLLRDDGVIFVSIDDNEVHNLRMVLNEIFGEENFVETFIWRSRLGKGSTSKQTATLHEYIVCYSKSNVFLNILGDVRTNQKQNKERIRQWGQGDKREDRPTMFYSVPSKEFGNVFPIKPDGTEGRWRVSSEKFKKLLDNNLVVFEKQNDGRIEAYRIIPEGTKTETAQNSILDSEIVKTTAHGSKELNNLFEFNIFDYPKPVTLLKHLIGIITQEDIILDFFAGSGTTANAVLDLNKEDGGNRKFICVQLPEKTDENSEAYKAGYKTIAEIGKERIRRVIKKLKEVIASETKQTRLKLDSHAELVSASRLDLGFKVFKLRPSNFKIWRTDVIETEPELAQQLDVFKNPVRPGAELDNMLYEILLKSGYDLNTKTEIKKLAGCPIHFISGGELMIALTKITEQAASEIIKLKPTKLVCLDRIFVGNDQLKTNTALQLKDAGIDFKTI